jgi:hypothetical protein
MTTENIVVEVKDSVDASISPKIRGIAKEARAAQQTIDSLQKSLSAINVNTLSSITKANKTAADTATAQAKAAAAQNQSAIAAQKLATATAQAERAQAQAALSAQRLADAQGRATQRAQAQALQAANAATAQARLAAAMTQASNSTNRAGISQKQYNAAMRGVPAQITDIVVSLQAGQRPFTVLLQQGGQLKDMFGGIVPAAKALSAGVVAMINPFTLAAAAVVALGIAMGKVESESRTFNGIIAQFKATGRNDLDRSFVVQLRKELNDLPGVSKSAATAIINEFASVRSVGGPILKDASKIVNDLGYALGTDAPKAAKTLAEALDDPLKGAIALDKQLGFLTVQNFKTIDSLMKAGKTAQAQKVLLDALGRSVKGLAEESMTPLQKATNNLSNAWDRFMGSLSDSKFIQDMITWLGRLVDMLGTLLGMLDKVDAFMQKGMNAGPGALVSAILGTTSNGGAEGSWDAPVGSTRSAEQMLPTKLKTDRAGITDKSAGKAAESRATALRKLNLELNNELRLMSMLGPEREKEEMFSRIQEQFTGRNIKLKDGEIKSIRGLIDAIVEGKEQQSEMNRIYQEAIQPNITYQATLRANNDLLARGVITSKQHAQQELMAFEANANFNDSLRETNKQIDEEIKLSKILGPQKEIEARLMQIQNELLTKGDVLRGDEIQDLRDRLLLLNQNNIATAAQNALLEDSVLKRQRVADQIKAISDLSKNPSSGFSQGDKASASSGLLGGMGIDTSQMEIGKESMTQIYTDFYSQLQLMREEDLINEADYQSAKAQLAAKQTSTELAGAKSFFGELATLQSSNIKELSQLGKAAAIVQAVINTYEGATKALAQGGIYGTAMAAAVVASGMAQVAQIRSQGFQLGGYTGNGGVSEVAGVVHGKEFVVNAAGTAKNRGLLEMMNRGGTIQPAASVGTSVGAGRQEVKVNLNNQIPDAQYEVQTTTAGEVEIIARRVARQESDKNTSAVLNRPNSKTFKTLQRRTRTERAY